MSVTSKTIVGNDTYSNDNYTKFQASKNQQGSVTPPSADAAPVVAPVSKKQTKKSVG